MKQVREWLDVAMLRAASMLHSPSLGEGGAVRSQPIFANGIRRLKDPST